MNVIQASAWFPPDSFGGVEVYLEGLIRDLKALGLNSKVAAARSMSHSSIEQYQDIEVYRYPAQDLKTFQTWLSSNKSEIYHQHTVRSSCGIPHLQVAKQLGMKTIVTIHMPDLACLRGTMMQGGYSACDGRIDIARCSRCLGVSKRVPTWMMESLSYLPSSIALQLRDCLRQSSDIRVRQFATTISTPAQVRAQRREFEQVVELSDRIVVVCQWLYDAFILNGVPESKLFLSRHGVSTNLESPSTLQRVSQLCSKGSLPSPPTPLPIWERGARDPVPLLPNWEKGLGDEGSPESHNWDTLISRPIRIGFLGRWQETKGVQILVEALQLIPNAPIELIIHATHADQHGAANQERVRAIANQDPRIQIKPPLPRTEISKTLSSFDLLAVPSQWLETGPLVVLESFAAGTPVIGSDLGGIAELVTQGIDGWLVPASDRQAWANTIASLQPETIAQFKQNISPVKTRQAVAEEMLQLYQSLMREY
jgi:glycosyltransferase involved in cell wall biosynthesis